MANPRTSSSSPSSPSSKRPRRMEKEVEDCIILEDKDDCFIVNANQCEPRTNPDRELASVKSSQGGEFYSKGQFLMARNLYAEAIQLDPGNAIYYANRAAANMSLNVTDTVLEDLEKAIKLDPGYLKAYSRKFNHLLSLGEIAKAERVIEKTKQIEANDKRQIDEETKKMQERIASIQHNQSLYEKATEKREHRDALHYIDQILQICSHSQEAKLKKAEVLACCLKHEQVIEIVDPILRRETTNSEALFIRGLSLYYQDNVEKAKAHFQQALKVDPDHRKSIEILKKVKQFKELKEEGRNEATKGNLNKAIELFKKAILIDPNNNLANAKVYFNLSIVYRRQNKHESSLKECNRAIELDPNYDKAYMKRGVLNDELQNYADSVTDYDKLYKKLKTKELKRALERAKLLQIQSKNVRKDYYARLGLTKTATQIDIKRAYRQKAMEYHPDRNFDSDDKQKAEQERMFKEVGESYNCLIDTEKRQLYDSNYNVNNDQTFFTFGPEVFKKFGCEPDVMNEFFSMRR